MFKLIRPLLKVWHLILMVSILVLCIAFVYVMAQAQQQQMRKNLLINAKIIANSINWQPLADDLKTAELQSDIAKTNRANVATLTTQLQSACKANGDCAEIYVLYVNDQKAQYVLDVPMNNAKKAVDVGAYYIIDVNNANSAKMTRVSNAQDAYVVSDQKNLISAYAPIISTDLPKLLLGIDVEKSRWNKQLMQALWLPILFTLAFMVIFTSFVWHHFKQLVQNMHSFESSTVEMSNVDALTGLSNRLILDDRMAQAIKVAIRAKSMVAILFVDLDYFKDINDTYGHGIGDQLLKKVADRLNTLMRAEDTIARVGGDEFVILLGNLKSENQAVIVADKIIEKITQPFKAGAKTLKLGASIGIAMYPQHDTNMQVLIKYADSAMYFSKRLGGGRCSVYDSSMSKPFDDKTIDKDFINTVAA